MHFFAGLTLDQVARTMELSPATIDRYWAYTRAFLFHELHGEGPD